MRRTLYRIRLGLRELRKDATLLVWQAWRRVG